MTSLLILRPQPGADATAARAAAMGLESVVAPLFRVIPVDWTPPDAAAFDAVLMTSANAARLGGAALARYRHLPLYAVGKATAAAAGIVGFANIVIGRGDGAEIVRRAVEEGRGRLLHLAGREHAELRYPEAAIERRIVYASDGASSLPDAARAALEKETIALLHSRRAASLFAALVDAAGLDRAGIAVIGLGDAVSVAAGSGWAGIYAAPRPDDDALLAIAARLCDQGGRTDSGEDRA